MYLKSVTNLSSERHVLFDLLMTYLKTKRSLTNTVNQLNDLTKKYMNYKSLIWHFERKEIESTVSAAQLVFLCNCWVDVI